MLDFVDPAGPGGAALWRDAAGKVRSARSGASTHAIQTWLLIRVRGRRSRVVPVVQKLGSPARGAGVRSDAELAFIRLN